MRLAGWHGLALAAAVMLSTATACARQPAPTPYTIDQPGGRPADFKLVWSDEFDRDGLPSHKRWDYETQRNREGWYSGEIQYYSRDRPQNARVEGGNLIIEARHDDFGARKPWDWGGQRYSSARLYTHGIASWTYGFVEVRAKLPCGKGTWPAIWMMPEDPAPHWPAGGEIDIMEHVGWDEGIVHGTLHTGGYNRKVRGERASKIRVEDVCGSFHRYQLDWNADRILIGVDDHNYFQVVNDHSGDRGAWPFDKPQYLLLNLAIGGWGGQKGVDDSIFPVQFLIDYVRVYQAPR